MTDEARFHEIDALVGYSGHRFNPQTERFEAAVGSDAENDLDHDWRSFLGTLPGVSEDEFQEYVSWKKAQAEQAHYQELADEMIEEREKGDDKDDK